MESLLQTYLLLYEKKVPNLENGSLENEGAFLVSVKKRTVWERKKSGDLIPTFLRTIKGLKVTYHDLSLRSFFQ